MPGRLAGWDIHGFRTMEGTIDRRFLRFRFALRACCLCFRFGFCLKLVILEFAGLESGVWEFLFRVYFWFILRSCFLGFGNNFY